MLLYCRILLIGDDKCKVPYQWYELYVNTILSPENAMGQYNRIAEDILTLLFVIWLIQEK